ncbi:unnamed protein product [Mycena citricolor]|uniref:Cytochrome P450 n=1 Tax=Mycena citricolor TaxID=2018698 RepID=A0AAD2Q3H3_9AGAR|nr:unnamed protein product [Mycena citricolor]
MLFGHSLSLGDTQYAFLLLSGVSLIVCLHIARSLNSGPPARHPPGPRPHPLVGHTLQVPTIQTWKYFERLSHQYGPIVRLSLAGDNVVVLSDPRDAEELLGRRLHNYSSRPQLIYAGKYQSNNQRMVLLPYGEVLKRQRSAFHQMLQPCVVGAYEDMQETESLQPLHDLVSLPEDAFKHCGRFAASLVFTLSYGERLKSDGKDLEAVQILISLQLYTCLSGDVKARMRRDIGTECFSARLWEQQEKMKLSDEELSYVAGSAFEAGMDTTTGTVLWFLMVALLFPETVKRAQAEIDSAVDEDTVPGFAVYRELPYCAAFMKELFRWAPAALGGFPHVADADDEYQGFEIRKGTMVIPCIWNMHHNEKEFPESYTFNPSRFLSSDLSTGEEHVFDLTEGHYGFGFGRRVCPGKYMATKTIWIAVVRILWAFNLELPENADLPKPECCTSGMTSKPLDFPIRITARSAARLMAIRREFLAAVQN